MPLATQHLHNRIAVLFDFDKTLAPDSIDALLEHCGYEPQRFRDERVQPLKDDGWDATLAQCYRIIEASRSGDGPTISRDTLHEVGRKLKPYKGVLDAFDRLRAAAHAVVDDVEVEFYLLTCGFIEIPRAMEIADRFEAMWGSELHYDAEGEVEFVKKIITFPEKVRYVLQLAKGLGTSGPNAPEDVYRDVPDEEWHVPLDQIIYAGDGGSDMPVFQLMKDSGGIAIGIFEEDVEDWSGYENMYAARRVQNLAKADYSEDSELMRSLMLAVESVAKLIQLRRLSQGE